ncbi:MAG: 4-hydroxythreonine-4-phosphate dehydrogenase PdxA [Pseudomonadota bacterium]
MSSSSPLCITLGDPAGCGPSMTMDAWRTLRDRTDLTFYVRGAPALYNEVPVALIADPKDSEAVFKDALPVIPLEADMGEVTPGRPDPNSAEATLESIEHAVADAMSGEAGGVVTNPISKALLNKAGFAHPGHTEYLAELSANHDPVPFPVMMLVGGGLRVALATIHMPLGDAIAAITPERLKTVARIVHSTLVSDFGLETPRIAFTGLNPHAGEGGMLGSEEIDIINPSAESLRRNGVEITDARPADTVFAEALSGAYDAVIAMTHDQGLIPVKTLDMWGGVNTTLGLPIVRTSPDHGTAYEATRAGQVRADSLIAAIRLAGEMAHIRAERAHG